MIYWRIGKYEYHQYIKACYSEVVTGPYIPLLAHNLMWTKAAHHEKYTQHADIFAPRIMYNLVV